MSNRGRPRTSTRLFADDYNAVNASDLIRDFWGKWPSSVGLTATFQDRTTRNFTAAITTSRMPTGGERAWFVCQFCRRRCGRLYFLHEQQRDFACRVCLRLAYWIQYNKGQRYRMYRQMLKFFRKV